MKKMLSILLCITSLLTLFGCGKTAGKPGENQLWNDASPETSAMHLYSFDKNGSKVGTTFDQTDEHAILDRLSAVDAVPVTDWTPDKVDLPVYGIEIGSMDGWGILAAWSNGYLILRDGSVYEFDFDFSTLEKDYEWEPWNLSITSLSSMPCGRLLSEGPDGWIADHLAPADELKAPEGISMVLKEQTAGKITVELTNGGNAEWLFGEYFSLQVLLDGVWYNVPVMDDKNYGFTDIGYILPPGKTQEESYSLGSYGTLPAGTYRLVVEGMGVEFTLPLTDRSIASLTDGEVTCVAPRGNVLSIVDHSLDDPDRAFATALEPFWEDDANVYSFSCIKSQFVTVYYDDGTEENVKPALQAGRVTMDDLDAFGIRYYTEPKA